MLLGGSADDEGVDGGQDEDSAVGGGHVVESSLCFGEVSMGSGSGTCNPSGATARYHQFLDSHLPPA